MTDHEKGIEAAARVIVAGLSGPAIDCARAIIAAYLAEAQPTSKGEEREAFEVWAGSLCMDLSRSNVPEPCNEYYQDERVDYAYAAWQARSAREGGK